MRARAIRNALGSERATRAKSYGKEDVTYGDEIKAHAKTGCAGEVSVIGVLAIYICIHQPSTYTPVSSERILVYEPNDVRSSSLVPFFSPSSSFPPHSPSLSLRSSSLASLLTFFSRYLLKIHRSCTYIRACVRTNDACNATRIFGDSAAKLHESSIFAI